MPTIDPSFLTTGPEFQIEAPDPVEAVEQARLADVDTGGLGANAVVLADTAGSTRRSLRREDVQTLADQPMRNVGNAGQDGRHEPRR